MGGALLSVSIQVKQQLDLREWFAVPLSFSVNLFSDINDTPAPRQTANLSVGQEKEERRGRESMSESAEGGFGRFNLNADLGGWWLRRRRREGGFTYSISSFSATPPIFPYQTHFIGHSLSSLSPLLPSRMVRIR